MGRQQKGDMEVNFEVRSFDVEISKEEYDRLPKHNLYIVLDNLRSAFNVGSIFRLCDTMRVKELILCGYTAYPPHTKLDKTSLGTIDYVPWKHFETTEEAIEYLKNKNIVTWAAETTSISIDYREIEIPEEVAVVFGNEALGVSKEVMELCDNLVEIPVYGYKNSLNVATACSIIGYKVIEKFNERLL